MFFFEIFYLMSFSLAISLRIFYSICLAFLYYPNFTQVQTITITKMNLEQLALVYTILEDISQYEHNLRLYGQIRPSTKSYYSFGKLLSVLVVISRFFMVIPHIRDHFVP